MYDFTAITKVCVEFKRQNLPCYPSTLNKKQNKTCIAYYLEANYLILNCIF